VNTIQTLLDAVALGAVYALIAVGIGLVFGLLRLINFAYGQIIMAGAYALALTGGLSAPLRIVICFAVVIGVTLAMDLAVFRPLRNASPARMLVATFAISFLLQNIALLKFGAIGNIGVVLPSLNNPATMAVNFAVPDGGTFVLFASDGMGIEFLPGAILTLTATFSDGTTATATTSVEGLNVTYNASKTASPILPALVE